MWWIGQNIFNLFLSKISQTIVGFSGKIQKTQAIFPVKIKLLLVLSFVLFSYISYSVFDNYPLCYDEYNYDFSSELFSKGQRSIPIESVQRPLLAPYVIIHEGTAFSKYPPGFPLLLSIGKLIGLSGLINPFFACLTLALIFLILKEVGLSSYAFAAIALTALNPYFLGYSASYFAQTTSLFFSVLCLFLTLKCKNDEKYFYCLGLSLGYYYWLRPLDAFIMTAAMLLFFQIHRAITVRRQIITYNIALCGIALFFLYNYTLAGKFGPSVYEVFSSREFTVISAKSKSLMDSIEFAYSNYIRNYVTIQHI